MGLGRSLKHAVKKVAKAVTKSVVNTTKMATGLMNPIKEMKELISNPLKYVSGKISDVLGLDALYKVPNGMTNGMTNAQTEEKPSAETNDELTLQDRARMISRQGGQGSIPLMLLGQDFDADAVNLDKDTELGGVGR